MTISRGFLDKIVNPFRSSSTRGELEEDLEQISSHERKLFPFEVLTCATRNFHHTNKLGQGGFGPVYKGKLGDGRDIAVKKLSQSSNQGSREFKNEAKLLSCVQHRNIVTLLGYCVHDTEKLLVYEYVLNQSLDKLLFNSDRRRELNWKRRHDIITGVARGLVYLHEDSHNRIIHRDIKASNILLDDKWFPKIADFGMARLFPEDSTHVNTRIAGTNGYMAPEYMTRGHLSEKADVYSFGILVLEIISGQKNSTFDLDPESYSLLDWAFKLYMEGRSLDIMDASLLSSSVPEQVVICIQIGLFCTQDDPKHRPDMQQVLVMLSKKHPITIKLIRPVFHGSVYRKSGNPSNSSSSTSVSAADTSNKTTPVQYSSSRSDSHEKRISNSTKLIHYSSSRSDSPKKHTGTKKNSVHYSYTRSDDHESRKTTSVHYSSSRSNSHEKRVVEK